MDERRFASAIGILGEAFREKVTATTIRAYRLGMRELSIEQVERAVAVGIEQRTFMPRPAELRQLAGVLSPEDRACLAWEVLRKAGCNRRESVCFDDPTIAATVRNLWGTWWKYCDVANDTRDATWLRKDFERVYCMLFRGDGGSQQSPLLGSDQRQYDDERLRKALGLEKPTARLVRCGRLATKSSQPLVANIDSQVAGLLENIGTMREQTP